MKWFAAGAVFVAAMATAAWFIWADLTQRAVALWLEDRVAEGWLAETGEIEVTGFPARFVTTIAPLSLADPQTGWAWTAPRMTLQQGAASLDQVLATWPETQSLASPFGRVTITADQITSRLKLQPTRNFALDGSTSDMRNVRLDSSEGWSMQFTEATAGMVRRPNDGETPGTPYHMEFDARDIRLPDGAMALLDPAGVMPQTVPILRIDAQAAFDRPWDLSALEASRPQPTAITLREARAQWGDLALRSSGDLTVDAEGRATGRIAIRAENWNRILEMAARSGALPDGVIGPARTALGLLAGMSGQPENIDATVRFDEGFAFIGPIPIGEAPRLVLR